MLGTLEVLGMLTGSNELRRRRWQATVVLSAR